jgi:hypothetical protein
VQIPPPAHLALERLGWDPDKAPHQKPLVPDEDWIDAHLDLVKLQFILSRTSMGIAVDFLSLTFTTLKSSTHSRAHVPPPVLSPGPGGGGMPPGMGGRGIPPGGPEGGPPNPAVPVSMNKSMFAPRHRHAAVS